MECQLQCKQKSVMTWELFHIKVTGNQRRKYDISINVIEFKGKPCVQEPNSNQSIAIVSQINVKKHIA